MIRRDNIVGGGLLFIAALHSGYALMPIYPTYFLALIAITTMLLFFLVRKLNIDIKLVCFLTFVFVLGYASSINSEVNLTALIKLQLVVLFSYFFVNYLDYNRFVRLYVYFMVAISCGSLFLYFIENIINLGIVTSFPYFENSNGMGYHNGFLLFFFSSEYVQYRNTGFFWEPGIFSSYLSLAVILSGHVKLGRDSIITMLLALTIFTTYSTSGYILLILALIAKYFSGGGRKYLVIIFSCLTFIIISIFYKEFIDVLRSYFPEVTNKFFVDESSSVLERIKSPSANIEAFIKSPFIGLGLNGVDELYKVKGDFAQTSTMTYYLGAFGILGFLYSYLILCGTVFNKNKNFKGLNGLLSFLVLIIILNKEPHMYFCLTYIVLFYWVLQSRKEHAS